MPSFNYFKGFASIRGIALLAVLLCLAAGDSTARTRKGDKFLKQAQTAEDAHKFDEAAGLYDQALDQDPTDVGYQLGSRRAHFEASQEHLKKGQKLRASGQLQPALVEFQRAFSLDASSAIAIEEMKTTMDMIDRNKKGNVPAAEQTLTPVQQEQNKINARLNEMQDVPRLKPISNEMHALTMNNQPPRVLYETVGKLAGINVIFDPQFNSPVKTADLDLSNSTLEQALDYIALLTHTFWQPISSNAIFVAEDNATKRRDYEDQVAKVFYLHNISTTQELQEVVNAVRTVTDLRRIFQYAALNAVIVRGNVGQVALAEKLFHDLDKPKSEVEVDVIILNANRSRTRNLTASIIDAAAGAAGLGVPIAFTPRSFLQPSGTGATTTPTTPTGVTPTPSTGGQTASPIVLGNIGKLNFSDFSTILPNAMLQAVMTDNSTKVLQSPQIRVSDGQKATLKIGQKYPYATGSFQPGIGTVGVSPLVSTQFQFADLGVTVEMTPHVNGNDQVTLHIAITIASHDGDITNSGLTQPILGNKQDETDIRLKDGEVSLLGGLLNTEVDSNVAGIPGLVNIPILGHFLFGAENKTNQRGELLIALIPHILRKPDLSPSDLRGVEAGTDQVVRVSYAEPSEPPAAPVPVPPASQPAQPSVMGAPRVAFSPGTIQAHVGDPVPVMLQMQDAHDLASAPVKIKWDPKLLRLNQVSPGALFTQDGQKVNAPIDIRNDIGEATITMSRPPGAPGVNGSGAVAVYQFVAVGHGSGNIAVTELGAKDSKQESIPLTLPALPVAVQ